MTSSAKAARTDIGFGTLGLESIDTSAVTEVRFGANYVLKSGIAIPLAHDGIGLCPQSDAIPSQESVLQ
jgi:hypothetical protein